MLASAVRPALTNEDRLWEMTAHYGPYTIAFGWTPEQVDSVPVWYAQRVLKFKALVDEVKEEKRIEAEKRAARQQGQGERRR